MSVGGGFRRVGPVGQRRDKRVALHLPRRAARQGVHQDDPIGPPFRREAGCAGGADGVRAGVGFDDRADDDDFLELRVRHSENLGFAHAGHITLDNLHPLETWPEVFAGQEVIVRIDPGRGHGHHKHVRTAGAQSKFGVTPEELERLRDLAETAGTRLVGFHAHVGSGILTPETWSETAFFLASLAEHFPDVRVLNIGGGFGVPERPGALPLDAADVARSLALFKKAHPHFSLWMEPGRYLVAEAGVLLARVTQVKSKGTLRYVGIETGMNSLIRPALYGSYHAIVNLTRLDAPTTLTADIVGPICETGDVLGHSRRLPETHEGDILLIATAGAYGRVMSNHYNLREPAAETMLAAVPG